MTDCSVYIGDLEDPEFHYDGGDWACNVPRALCQSFPPVREHYNLLYRQWTKLNEIECKQTDYDSHVARVKKNQIQDYLAFAYGSNASYTDPQEMLRWEGRPYLVEKLEAIKAFVESLNDDKEYGLVAMCI